MIYQTLADGFHLSIHYAQYKKRTTRIGLELYREIFENLDREKIFEKSLYRSRPLRAATIRLIGRLLGQRHPPKMNRRDISFKDWL